MPITRQPLGSTHDGRPVDGYTLANDAGMAAKIMTYGGILMSLQVPDRHGRLTDVVLGFDTLTPYLGEHPYFGAIIGRYANRIARGRFRVQDVDYQLACNNGPNHLHGGRTGFDRRLWRARPSGSEAEPQLTLSYLSPDGEEGYPGNLQTEVAYTLTARNELRLDFRAQTDAPTIINLSHHAYFNLAGYGTVLDHHLRLLADRFLPVDDTLIPTGEQALVAGTAMDFQRLTPIGSRLQPDDEQLRRAAGGYDHNWIVTKASGRCQLAAEVAEPSSGRRMSVYTTQPGIQFYSGNFLDGRLCGKGGRFYEKHAGFCLEPQHFPDSPNQPGFPSTLLQPADDYRHTIVYRFDAGLLP
jgi:aldose 1-epimerase